MKKRRSITKNIKDLLYTKNPSEFAKLLEHDDKKLQTKILRNIHNLNEICKKYSWDFEEIITMIGLVDRMSAYISFGSVISLNKFKSIFRNAEEKYALYCNTKTKKMQEYMAEDPQRCDTGSLDVFKKRYKDDATALEKYTEYHKNKTTNTRLCYWLDKGFTEDEAKDKLKERQITFSLEKCIAKYGKEVGEKRWGERQKKWRASFANKDFAETILINFKCGGNMFPTNAAYFIGVPAEEFTDEIFFEYVASHGDYISIVLQKFTQTFDDYAKITRKLTDINYTKFKHIIDPNSKRNRKVHLDHRYSVFAGFVNKVSPEIISHPCNLEMIDAFENFSKNAKCSISLETLYEQIKNFS